VITTHTDIAQRTVPDRRRARRGRIEAQVTRRPLAALIGFIVVGIWPLMSIPILAHHRVIAGRSVLDRLPMGAEETVSLLMVGALLAFTLWLVGVCDGAPSVRQLLRRTFQWRIGLPAWLVVIAGLPAATVALAVLFGRELVTTNLAFVLVKGFATLALLVVVVNLWEETIWAGFAQPRLERRHRLAAAAALTAVPFALVHVPLVFVDEPFSIGTAVGQFLLLMIVSVPFRTLLGVTARGLTSSVLALACMHTAFNRSNNAGGLADQLLAGNDHPKFGLLAMLLLLAIGALLWRRPRNNGHQPARDEPRSNPRWSSP
jgi:membrane protease YdiL (CAAX protease family)